MEPRRLQILQSIWDEERSVGEIAEALPVSIAAVSQHLAKLRAAGLVTVRAEGRRRFYQATKADMGALAVMLESFWTDRLGALETMAKTMENTPEVENE
jgi:DNA-binding transcriptional ArsR family regulator